MTWPRPRVIVCQIGAREHYAIPRLLHRHGMLDELITDVWVPPGSPFGLVPGGAGERLRGRYHPELAGARVTHFTGASIGRSLSKSVVKSPSRWADTINQNEWFQAEAVRHLRARKAFEGNGAQPLVLAYSYAARDILAMARDAGALTMLGQIDGGAAEDALVASLWARSGQEMPNRAPPAYWEHWRQECELAGRIVVNSDWSRQLLIRTDIPRHKLVEVPVIYEMDDEQAPNPHSYPEVFDNCRPLNVLFLGTLTQRKGISETLAAARLLECKPVRFTLVGGDPEGWALRYKLDDNITYHGRVPRSKARRFYDAADVFLFPTHSDGFGMTQVEALASGLPVIASRNCATLVESGRNGIILDEVSPRGIEQALLTCLNRPDRLTSMSAVAADSEITTLLRAGEKFMQAVQDFTASRSH